jgi:hypothetical protein
VLFHDDGEPNDSGDEGVSRLIVVEKNPKVLTRSLGKRSRQSAMTVEQERGGETKGTS